MDKLNIFSPEVERADYNRVKKTVGSNFVINAKALRLEAALDPNKSSYTLDMAENVGADRPLEIKLNRNDAFFITHSALGIVRQNEVASPKQYGNFPLFTYPDPNYFNGDDTVNLLEYQALECLFNGKVTLNTSPTDRLVDFATNQYKYIPERGYMEAGVLNTNEEIPQYGPSLGERGFFKHVPNIIFDGQDNNRVKIDLGAGDKAMIDGHVDSANAAVDTRNVLVFMLFGFVVINGAKSAKMWAEGI